MRKIEKSAMTLARAADGNPIITKETIMTDQQSVPVDAVAMPASTIDYEQKYHGIMDALKRSKMKHGDCKSGKRYNGLPLACAACMANLEIETALHEYKGRLVRLA